ncbi:hypothetical protein TNCT_258191 [Trichonephila clavata]|uniref:Uncharacterized protein n=1 Tax=Trichonephila clavata TaxID=2740835 RepID=A0A8X6GT66_TRICU|nr:hypothetical protein TNCT_258191 [Trichonephila clavata]
MSPVSNCCSTPSLQLKPIRFLYRPNVENPYHAGDLNKQRLLQPGRSARGVPSRPEPGAFFPVVFLWDCERFSPFDANTGIINKISRWSWK